MSLRINACHPEVACQYQMSASGWDEPPANCGEPIEPHSSLCDDHQYQTGVDPLADFLYEHTIDDGDCCPHCPHDQED